ncbi:ATP-binding protein [Carboxylicivirga marina]|uniref:ATP-binding protein n=1 Tax=Carboxylicivirga marina TaxID=2800988 RepID=UPI002597C3A0|nr:ATP-binding protein [uncultured Carboxylicivirga sp.]
MRKDKLIFLGGIHGVGKGTFCKKLSNEIQLECVTASQLINWAKINNNKQSKTVENINNTQQILINSLNERKKDRTPFLLDGHYCLLNQEKKPTSIDILTFKKITPGLLLILTEDSKVIKSRLEERDQMTYTLDLINQMQELEIAHAKLLSSKLEVELISFTKEDFPDTINKIKTFNEDTY